MFMQSRTSKTKTKMSVPHAVLTTQSLKRCTFGRWKPRLLALLPTGDIAYGSPDGLTEKGTIRRSTIHTIATAIPGADPDPPHLPNAHMFFVESSTKKTYFVVSSQSDLEKWLSVLEVPPVLPLRGSFPRVLLNPHSIPTQGFVTSINLPMTATRFEWTADGSGLCLQCPSSIRVINLQEVYCVFEYSLMHTELNSCAILCFAENFVCFFYDVRARTELMLQLKRRAPSPALFLELQAECMSLLEREVIVQDLRKNFNQFERELNEIIGLPFNDGLSAPYVVIVTVAHIAAHGCGLPGIFRICGSASSVTALRNAVDSSQDVFFLETNDDVHNACGLLKLFLRLLPTPLLTEAMVDCVVRKDVAEVRRLVSDPSRPMAITNTMRYLFYILWKIDYTTKQKPSDQAMTAHTLSILFAAVITPAASSGNGLLGMMGLQKYSNAIFFLIENYLSIWKDSGEITETVLAKELTARQQSKGPESRVAFHPTL